MTENLIVNGKEYKIFDRKDTLEQGLVEVHEAKFSPVFMPKLADLRIVADKDHPVWQLWFSTPSAKYTALVDSCVSSSVLLTGGLSTTKRRCLTRGQ